MQSDGRRRSAPALVSCALVLGAVLLMTGMPRAGAAEPLPGLPFATASHDSGSCAGGVAAVASLAQPMANTTACEDCDSNQGYCTPGNNVCRNYCLQLVGLEGICHQSCNCCVCPEGPPPPPPPDGGGGVCQPVCRCDGVPGPQGLCPSGCRQVSCI